MTKSFDAAEGMLEIEPHQSLRHLFSLFNLYITSQFHFTLSSGTE